MDYTKEIKKRERHKKVRTVGEVIVVVIVLLTLYLAFFCEPTYEPYTLAVSEEGVSEGDNGFIAVSYFGVDRNGTNTLISKNDLDKQLHALKESGYVTITQADIVAYYEEGKALPEKALFLMVEDGRTDSAIFTQPLLKKHNYIATMTSYGENFESKDSKFFSGKQLQKMLDTSFWEMGSNGYRLRFINTFDRYGRFLGELNPDEFNIMRPYIGREYNHYLMDYIRDEYDIPMEAHEELLRRIENEYTLLEQSYLEHMGEVPELYVLMHSNTGQFGTNDDASEANKDSILNTFTMNFNREGDALNERDDSIYDLSRIQPQAHWSTNHLLMRIQDDTKQEMQFELGDKKRQEDWNQINGVSEFLEEEIILTSTSQGLGTLKLKKQTGEDLQLSVELGGNKLGTQRIYVRSDEAKNTNVLIQLENNELSIIEQVNGVETVLYSQNLDAFDQIDYQSIQEHKDEAYKKQTEVYRKRGIRLAPLSVSAVADTQDYIPAMELNHPSNRKLDIEITNNLLSVYVDNRVFAEDLPCTVEGTYLFLECAPALEHYSQRNLTDAVYDGVFKKLHVTTDHQEAVIDYRIKGIGKVMHFLKESLNSMISWFIEVF